MAIERLYRPVWSSAILEELEFHEEQKLLARGEEKARAAERARGLIQQMRDHFDDAEVSGWEPLEGSYGLPDPDDEHVVAAAFVAGAGAIVTWNNKDFPAERLPRGLVAIPPPEFALNTVAVDPTRAANAVSAIASRSGRNGPRISLDNILDTLQTRYGLGEAVALMRDSE